MTNAIRTLALSLARSADLTLPEVERVARWLEDGDLMEPLGIDADAFQRAVEHGDDTLPESARKVVIAGLVDAVHVVLSEGPPPRTLKQGRAEWLLRRIGQEGSPFWTVAQFCGLSRARMAEAMGVSQWQMSKLYRPDWVEVVPDDHDELLAQLGTLLAEAMRAVPCVAAA